MFNVFTAVSLSYYDVQERLDKEQLKRQEAELVRMFDLLEMKLIENRDISEETCMLIDKKVVSFSTSVQYVIQS